MSKQIPLTRGYVAIVDEEDYEVLARHKWQVEIGRKGGIYAVRCLPRDEHGKQRQIRMHRVIANPPPGMEVDHVNGNGLDNRRQNLRLATRFQNAVNCGPKPGRKFKGVRRSRSGRWIACIVRNRTAKYLGVYSTEEEAAKAYDAAAIKLDGPFARLNLTLSNN